METRDILTKALQEDRIPSKLHIIQIYLNVRNDAFRQMQSEALTDLNIEHAEQSPAEEISDQLDNR